MTTPTQPTPEKLLCQWTAPARPYKVRNREFYTTIASIVFLLTIILLLLKEFLLIGVIIAFAFLSYILATYKPDNLTHQLTTLGIKTEGKNYPWDNFTQFWIEPKYNQELLIIKTKKSIPGALFLVLDSKQKSKIINTLTKHLPQQKPQDTFVTKASQWLTKKIPLES